MFSTINRQIFNNDLGSTHWRESDKTLVHFLPLSQQEVVNDVLVTANEWYIAVLAMNTNKTQRQRPLVTTPLCTQKANIGKQTKLTVFLDSLIFLINKTAYRKTSYAILLTWNVTGLVTEGFFSF